MASVQLIADVRSKKMEPRKIDDPVVAILYSKHDGMVRLVAIAISIIFWVIVALVVLFLYLYDNSILSVLDKPYQVATALGLSPVALGVLTWRFFEKMCCLYLNSYVEKYLKT